MTTKRVISEISKELSTIDQPLYAFQPVDSEESFFIGEAAIVVAATILLNAFLDGLKESLQDNFKKWGKKTGNYVGEKIENIFKKKNSNRITDNEQKEQEINRNVKTIKQQIKEGAEKNIHVNVDESQQNIENILRERGIAQERAKEISNVIKEAGLSLINEMLKTYE